MGVLNPTIARREAVFIGTDTENNSRGWLVNLAPV